MKFIEIAEGLSIKICDIEAISMGEDKLTSIIKTHHNIFKSTFPYNVLLDLLEMEMKEPEKETEQQKLNILKLQDYFAG